MKKVALILAPGFEEVEAVTPLDFLRRVGIDVFVGGVGAGEISGAHGIVIKCDGTLGDAPKDCDGVVIPGGIPGAPNIAASKEARALIQAVYDRGGLVAAICASPALVLGKTGILSGRRATCYPGFEEHFDKKVRHVQDRVVKDGNVITSQGPGTAAGFAIEIIRYLLGDEAAGNIHGATLQK